MKYRDIQIDKEQFKLLNDDDQFQLFCDDEGFPDFKDFNEEVNKLYDKFEFVLVTEDDHIYGIKKNRKVLLSDQATEVYLVAKEITQ